MISSSRTKLIFPDWRLDDKRFQNATVAPRTTLERHAKKTPTFKASVDQESGEPLIEGIGGCSSTLHYRWAPRGIIGGGH